jgi:hypothetical protein
MPVVERAWLGNIQSRNCIAHAARIFFCFRLRQVNGDYAQSFTLTLIAQLRDLREVNF